MVKLDTKWIFWSLAVHRYPIKPHLLSIFKTRGPGMKSIIDKNFIAKKMKIQEFLGKYMLYTSKESLEHVEFRFKMKKCDFLKKKHKFWNCSDFDQKGGPFGFEVKNSLFSNFQNFRFFFWKWLQGVNVTRNKVMKYELIWSVRQGVAQDHLHVHVDCAPNPRVA